MSSASRAAAIADEALELTVVGSFSRIGFAARRALFGWDSTPQPDLHDRTVVITAATGGLGLAAAHLVARRGAQLCLIGRDTVRTDSARRSVVDATPDARVQTVVADLASLDAVRGHGGPARRMGSGCRRVDPQRRRAHPRSARTADGLELTAQVHVVAPFLLTTALLPILQATPDARVITVSSGGMYTQRLDLDTLATPAIPFNGVRAYANAKRAQVVLNELWSKTPRRVRRRVPRDAPRLGRHARCARVAASLSTR